MLPSNYSQSLSTPFSGFPFLDLSTTDATSPELFKHNLHLVQEHLLRVQGLAQNALAEMSVCQFNAVLWPDAFTLRQNAYHTGNSSAQTEGIYSLSPTMSASQIHTTAANLSALKEALVALADCLQQTGVGALPLIPDQSKPLEAEQITAQINETFTRLTRNQESAANVASLLSAPGG
jgi:hypothetical protein